MPVWIHLQNREPFAFAGLWYSWRNVANALVRRIHNRMSVIYDKEMGRQWLEESFGPYSMPLAAGATAVALRVMEAHEGFNGRQFT